MLQNLSSACSGPSGRVLPHLDRRGFLRGSLGSLLGTAIPLWQASAQQPPQQPRATAFILLWMNGGPSHLETFDPKPGTATGGPFRTIPTSLRGVQFCEHLPNVAEQAHHLAIVRSMTSTEGNHDRGQYLLHTGYAPSVTLRHPSLGSWVSHQLGNPNFELPNYVCIQGRAFDAGFLGVQHNPFAVRDASEGIRNMQYAREVNDPRFRLRMQALSGLQQQFHATTGAAGVRNHDAIYQRALRMMRSPLARAFDIHREPDSVRNAYGDSDFGKGCLMARRLVEAGVKFVEVILDGWDTHVDNFTRTRNLLNDLDPAFAMLLRDLSARNLLDQTLVVWMGEFGRTPRINQYDGRDHFPTAWCSVLAGGGVRVGQAYGSTDERGERITANPVTVPNFFATLATLMGMQPGRTLMSPVGRPIAISDNGVPVRGLMAQ